MVTGRMMLKDEEAINRAIAALSPDGGVLYFDGVYKLPENTGVL